MSAPERQALIDNILDSVTGLGDATTLRCTDTAGRMLTIVSDGHHPVTTFDDGSPAPVPLGALGADRSALRSIMVLSVSDLGPLHRTSRDDDPPELVEARATLEELTAELEAAMNDKQSAEGLQREIDRLEEELRTARDGLARREYAQVLARLEQVRAEAAAVHAGTASIDSDRNLLSSADTVRDLARVWAEAAAAVAELRAGLNGATRPEAEERELLAAIPSDPPAHLKRLVDELVVARETHDALDERLQTLSVSKLPAPSDPMVADLGLLDSHRLWETADELRDAIERMREVLVSLGGVEVDDIGPTPEAVASIELAHAAAEAAERAAGAAKAPGIGGGGLGVAAGAFGLTAAPILVPVAVVGAAVAAGAGLIRPSLRRSRAVRAEREALERADATSYLGFHIRRVEASVDPKLRVLVESSLTAHRVAAARWTDLTGGDVTVERALELRTEIEEYHEALRNLGDTADEIEQLREQVHGQAGPASVAAREAVAEAIEPYLLADADLDDLDDLDTLTELVQRQCDLGATARALLTLAAAESEEDEAATQLEELLLKLGFEAGPLDARVGALEWAVSRAAEREAVRAQARPSAELESELVELQKSAAALRRPEWATVTAAEAASPDIPELEARLAALAARLAEEHVEVDIERLADRHAAVERRVTSLEARAGGRDSGVDPSAIAELQQQIRSHLGAASSAGPSGDPIPVVLDEVLLRVPADRKWDLLDQLRALTPGLQLIYLSDDAFVAAWARQQALDGTITLLELSPEPV
ncbi:MAG: hypothetical protein ACT4OV_06210 [Microthrixaceae bacterium]